MDGKFKLESHLAERAVKKKSSPLPFAVLESPYTSDIERNTEFVRACARWFHETRGLSVFASHLYFPRFLDESEEKEREIGIEYGQRIGMHADEILFCLPKGKQFTDGMVKSLATYARWGIPCKLYIFRVRRIEFEDRQSGEFYYDGIGLKLLRREDL